MSFTRFRSQGLYERATPEVLSAKTYLAGFQNWALTSGLVATPASPIAPALESGVIETNGTAELAIDDPDVGYFVCPFDICTRVISANAIIIVRFIIKSDYKYFFKKAFKIKRTDLKTAYCGKFLILCFK